MLTASLIVSGSAVGYMQVKPMAGRVVPARSSSVQMGAEATNWKAAGLAAALAVGMGIEGASAGPFTRTDLQSLTYGQIKGTGLANTCPKVEAGSGTKITLSGGKKYKIEEFCLEVCYSPQSVVERSPAV